MSEVKTVELAGPDGPAVVNECDVDAWLERGYKRADVKPAPKPKTRAKARMADPEE